MLCDDKVTGVKEKLRNRELLERIEEAAVVHVSHN
jgi:hypothetical protein